METLETLGKRIATTADLQSLVRTMKALSFVSIRQYERAVAAQTAYKQTVEQGLQILLKKMPLPPETKLRSNIRTAAIVFGSDQGLCGRFNEQICQFARWEMQQRIEFAQHRHYLAVGMQVASRLDAMSEPVDDHLGLPGGVGGLSAMAHTILGTIDTWQAEHGIECVLLFRNARASHATAVPSMIQLLPFDVTWLRDISARAWPSRALPAYSMDGKALFSALIREHLFFSVFQAAAESMASEHATRLASMQTAERNIQEHLEEMNGMYRQRRQEAITEELLDVVAGFESLRAAESPQDV